MKADDRSLTTEEEVTQFINNARIKIPGITCANCVLSIKKSLTELKNTSEGIIEFKIDASSKFLNILYQKDKIEISEILTLLNEINKPGILTEDLPINQKNKATLHFASQERLKDEYYSIMQQKGVINVIPSSNFLFLRIFYDPHTIGARTLRDNILKAMPKLKHSPKIGNSFDDIGEELQLYKLKRNIFISIPFSLAVFIIMMVLPHHSLPLLNRHDIPGISWKFFISFVLTTPVHFWIGYPIHRDAYFALKNRSSNMSVLISLATNICYFYSLALLFYSFISSFFGNKTEAMVFFETSAVLITFILIGRYIEARVKHRTKNEINRLQGFQPDSVTVLNPLDSQPNTEITSNSSNTECSQGNFESFSKTTYHVELLELNDIVEIKEGAMIPTDGIMISSDTSDVDESMITGESKPIPKVTGENLIGGTIVSSGYIIMQVTHIGSSTILGQMITILKSSSANMSFEKIADRIGRIFVPLVVTLSIITWITWGILVSGNFVASFNDNPSKSASQKALFVLEFGIAVLAIACPCALGLAAPTATAVASGMAAKNSILIKRTNLFEAVNKITHIVFDKTGTLTKGSPSIEASYYFGESVNQLKQKWKPICNKFITRCDNSSPGEDSKVINFHPPPYNVLNKTNLTNEEFEEFDYFFWTTLYSLEKKSGHHIAKAIVSHAENKFGINTTLAVKGFTINSKDRSISANIEKLNIRIGSISAFDFNIQNTPDILNIADKQFSGSSLFLVKFDNLIVALVELRDELRPEAKSAIRFFKNRNIDVYICSGDHENTVKSIANSLELDPNKTLSQQSPFEKAEFIQNLSKKGVVAMAGDGINDSLALSKASIGIAIGEVSNITSSAADIIVVKPNLSNLIYFFDLSNKTIRTIYRNYIWASVFNLVCIPLAAGILYPLGFILPPAVAGAIMAVSSISVVLSSLLLKNIKIKSSFA